MFATLRSLFLAAAVLLAWQGSALAHVSVSGPAYANQNGVLTFGVGHGCEGADTVAIEVTIPSEVSGIRVVPSGVFPTAELVMDGDVVTAVKWSKDGQRDGDDAYYSLQIRARMPDAPFTTLLFPTKQTCRKSDGTELVTDWKATPEEAAAAPEGEEIPPAPALTVLPVRAPGWNKFTVKAAIKDLKLFNDAEIVWLDDADAAYSGNATTMELIKAEDGVTELTEIKANTVIWVKY